MAGAPSGPRRATPPSSLPEGDEPREGRLTRADGRTVAWTAWGDLGGRPLVRLHGTPGSRYPMLTDPSVWRDRGILVITIERPGYGASTPLPGRGFAEPADDVAAVLDALGIDAVPIYGGSGATPYLLSFAARHPARTLAVSVVVGTAPLEESEVDAMIPANVAAQRLAIAGDLDGLRRLLESERAELLADPLAAFAAMMSDAPDGDRAVLAEGDWKVAFERTVRTALEPGVDGWLDDCRADASDWTELDPKAVATTVTWWHSAGDRNCPLSAAERLVARLPRARLVVVDEDGHLAPHRLESTILDELLDRADREASG